MGSLASKARKVAAHPAARNLALCFPVLLVYELGLLATDVPAKNGVDWLTVPLVTWLGPGRLGLLLLALFGVSVGLQRVGGQPYLRPLGLVVLESTVYALAMGLVIATFMRRVLGMSPVLSGAATIPMSSPIALGGWGGLVLACGAGIYEEAVFRWLGIGGLKHLGIHLGMAKKLAMVVALLASAALFSFAHHIGPASDPLRLGIFTYRFLAGVLFGLLFLFRGFPVAVYTHALYDVYAMVVG